MDFKVGDSVRIQGADQFFTSQIPPVKIDGKIGEIIKLCYGRASIVSIDYERYHLENCWLEKNLVEPAKDAFNEDLNIGDEVIVFDKSGIIRIDSGKIVEAKNDDMNNFLIRSNNSSRIVNYNRKNLRKNSSITTKNEKENKNMRNNTLERWYEKNYNALAEALDREKEIFINEDGAILHITRIIKELNEYLEDFNAWGEPIYFDKRCHTTKKTDDKIDKSTEKTNKLKTELTEKKTDVYALLSMCSDKEHSSIYEPFGILRAQGIIDKDLNIIVEDYDLSVE